MRQLGTPISYVTVFGMLFLTPYSFKLLFYYAFSRQFTVNFSFVEKITFVEYAALALATFSEPGHIIFSLAAFLSAICGSIFDVILSAQIKHTTENSDVGSVVVSSYTAEIAGMITGNNCAFFASQYFEWASIYRFLILISAVLVYLNLGYLRTMSQIPPKPSFSLSLISGTKNIKTIVATVMAKLQNAFMSQTGQLFLLDRGIAISQIAGIKILTYAGTGSGILISRALISRLPILMLMIRPIGLAGLAILTLLQPSCMFFFPLAACALLLEKTARSTENIFIMDLHIKNATKSQAAIQISLFSSIGQITKATGEMISGTIISILGWKYFFIFLSVLSIVNSVFTYCVNQKTKL